MTKKNEFNAPQVQRWSQLLSKQGHRDLTTFRKWLHRDRWQSAGEIVTALLKRFQKPPLDPPAP